MLILAQLLPLQERVGPRKSEFAALRDSLSKRVLTEVLVLILGWVEQVMETITHGPSCQQGHSS